ncbi:MAG: CoA transferase [Sphingomonadales bacterium]|nr:CoA transferase [Sphingomonadales bacterium]
MTGPLSHLRVLDLSRVLAGPWAGQILADLGAEVIKVERPGTGDDTRGWGPPFLKDRDGRETQESAYYLSTNRGKQSVAVDITTPAGQEIIRKLAARSDILLENYKVGGLKKYGLDYASLSKINDRLIYCSITGFGQTGPYKDRAGYDFLLQGMGGLMSITGEPDGRPGGGPMKVGVAIVDVMTGMYAAVAVLAALAHRERTGKGDHIDLSLLDVQVASLANQAMNYLIGGAAPGRLGNAHPNIVPYQAFATAEGHLILAIGNDQQFARFCAVASAPELALDPRFATNAARVKNRDIIVGRIAELLAARPATEWLVILEKEGVPCGPINTIDQVFANPQVVYRGLKIDLPHPLAGTAPAVKSPINFRNTDLKYDAAAPLLGAHTERVLRELGYDAAAIAAFKADGITGD